MTGPLPAGNGQSTWRVSFGGMSRLEIVLRRTTTNPTVLFARTVATQNLNLPEGTSRYEIQVESAKVDFSALTFQYERGFVPISVRVNNLAAWSTVRGENGTGSIVVRLRESTRSAAVVITGTLNLPQLPKTWTSPGVWLNAGVVRAERLTLVVAPGLHLRDWNSRGFRLVRSEASADRSYTIDLERVAFGSGSHGERPSLILGQGHQATWRAMQKADWRIGVSDETLAVKTSLSASDVLPRTIRFPLPDSWQVERVETGLDETAWTVIEEPIRKLEMELGTPRRNAEVNILLRRAIPAFTSRRVAYPDLLPEDCDSRSGALTVYMDPSLEIVPSDPVLDGPAIRPSSSGDQFTRTLVSEAPSGWLVVRPRAAPIGWRSRAKSNRLGSPASSTRL